jgi:glyoxylase-like metal-dependent hydrolase (beta-lactamase superfamily II)
MAPSGPKLVLDAAPCLLAPGLFGVRFALPFALDHVNLWLLQDGRGWTVVDTGIADPPTRRRWEELLAGFLLCQSVDRVLVTHFHPDHMGLAGWLCEATGAGLWTTRTEWLVAQGLAHDASEAYREAGRRFDRLAGLAEAVIEERAARGNAYRRRVVAPPASYKRVRAADRIMIDGDSWRVLIGRGHAPEMACLYSPARNLLIAGDQVLPQISPNVSVWPAEPEADPLGEFLDSLRELKALPEDCLVLPSHGQPFVGLHGRIDALIKHHRERLALVLERCREPATAVQIMATLFTRELDSHQLAFALGESIAHVNYLVERAQLSREIDPDGRWRYARR